MKNQCIKWAERCDFTEYYLIISRREIAIKGRRFPNWVEWELTSMGEFSWSFVIHIGRIPECETITIENIFQKEYERIQNIQDSSMFWKPYRIELKPSDTCTGAEKHLAELLEDSRDKEALQWLKLRNATVRDLEQQHVQADRRFNQERTDAAEHVATNRAASDAIAKPKRTKATKHDVDKAIDFLIYRYKKSKRKDWEQATVNAELFTKFGKEFDLSKKTRLGKIWAILHHRSTEEPPKGWTYDDITNAINAIGKDNNLWDTCRK